MRVAQAAGFTVAAVAVGVASMMAGLWWIVSRVAYAIEEASRRLP